MDPLCLLCFRDFLCHTVLNVHCSLEVTCWERADLLALLCVLFFLVFCHYPIWRPGSDVVLHCIDS